jgi:hypothetical protein
MFCSKCEKEISEDSNFCSFCGSKIRNRTSQYSEAGTLGCLSLFVPYIIALFLVLVLMNHSEISKDYENIIFVSIWIALAAVPLWLSGRYLYNKVPSLGWKWGLWIGLPMPLIAIVFIPFANLDMAAERDWIIVGAIGTAIAALSAWYYSSKLKK